jgi:hemerythrin-like domain-containing protein
MYGTQILMNEHQSILRTLACMEKLLSNADYSDEPRQTYVEIVDFLRSYADRLHHGKEEALLFPALEAAGMSADQGPTAVMRHEHDIMRGMVRRIHEQCENEEFNRSVVVLVGLQFVEMLRSHIAKEDHILFPMAERMLGADGLEELRPAYAAAEATAFDEDPHERYETWARDLAQRLGIDDERFEVQPACHG